MAFQGSLRELPLPDIVQLVSVSGKTGVFTLRNGSASGEIFLRDGQIVHAASGGLVGEEAVYELAVWSEGDFVFHPNKAAPTVSIRRSNTNLLMEAARRIDEWQVLSKRIPSTRLVPLFTHQAKTSSVSLTPAEWSLVSRIDERRSIEEIAVSLGESPFEVCKTLYGLLTSGLVILEEGLPQPLAEALRGLSPERAARGVEQIRGLALQLAKVDEDNPALAAASRLAASELAAGRHADAVIDFLRSAQRLLAARSLKDEEHELLARAAALFGSR